MFLKEKSMEDRSINYCDRQEFVLFWIGFDNSILEMLNKKVEICRLLGIDDMISSCDYWTMTGTELRRALFRKCDITGEKYNRAMERLHAAVRINGEVNAIQSGKANYLINFNEEKKQFVLDIPAYEEQLNKEFDLIMKSMGYEKYKR